jgi:polysaccharide chain length determinant protein (PEP-CTERM system associated)
MPTPPTQYDDTAKGPGLAGLLEIARRRRVLALLPFLFVLTAAASLAVFLPSVWTAKTLVLVNRQQIPERFVAPTVLADIEARLLTLSQDVLTPDRLLKIAQDYGLYQNLRRTQPADEVVEQMRRDIRLEMVEDKERRPREQRSVLFNISYRAPDPNVAVGVTNTLASLYIQENGRLREKQAAGTTAFLDTQLAEVGNKLKAQEQRITEYKEKNIGELPEQRDTNVRTLERLQQQLQLASENNRRANERKQLLTDSLGQFDMTSGMVAGPAGTGPNITPADTAAARLSLLRQELAVMQTKFHDRYPDVIQMKDQIRILEAKVDSEKKAQAAHAAQQASQANTAAKKPVRDLRVAPQNPYIQSLMTQLDQAHVDGKASSQEIADINRQIAVYQRRLENTPKREQELAIITRDYESTRELHKALLAKRGEADMASELEQRQQGETFRVIEPARLPEQPAGPNRFRLLLVGLALALGASGVAVLLAEQVDTSFRRVDEVRATAPMPVLSAIPRITTEQDRYRQLRQRRWATAAVAVGLFVVAGTSFLVAHNNQSMVALLMPAQPTATPGR